MLDYDGYIYSRKKNDDTVLSSAWRCQKNKSLKCPGKCYLALTDNTLSLGSKPHNHDSDLAAPQRLELLTTLKRKAAEQHLSATQNLISEVLADASTIMLRAIKEQQVVTDYHLDRLAVGKTPSKKRRISSSILYDLCSFYTTYPTKIEYLFAVAKYFGNNIE